MIYIDSKTIRISPDDITEFRGIDMQLLAEELGYLK